MIFSGGFSPPPPPLPLGLSPPPVSSRPGEWTEKRDLLSLRLSVISSPCPLLVGDSAVDFSPRVSSELSSPPQFPFVFSVVFGRSPPPYCTFKNKKKGLVPPSPLLYCLWVI